MTGFAVKPTDSTFEDYKQLLNIAGFNIQSFDIADLSDTTRNIKIEIREYVNDSITDYKDSYPLIFKNRIMIDDYPESSRTEDFYKEAENVEAGVYATAKKINFGFKRTPGDSVVNLVIDIPEFRIAPKYLALRKLFSPASPSNGCYFYNHLPYKVSEIKLGKFLPLVIYASGWYDPEFKVNRFCAKDILTENDTLPSPHYYIIGMVVN